jgi:hypothetical protein
LVRSLVFSGGNRRSAYLAGFKALRFSRVTIQGSGFESKKQAIFLQSSLFFEGDAAHRLKKEAQDGGKWTFLDQNGSTLNSYFHAL